MDPKNQYTTRKSTREQLAPLIKYLSNYGSLSDDIIAFLCDNCLRTKIPRGSFLLKPGELCEDYYYIHKGILRSYVQIGKKEVTIWINPEGEITTSIRNMTSLNPSKEYIQAIEDSDLVIMSLYAMEEMYERFPEMNKIGRKILQEYYAGSEERVYINRIPNARARYQHFMQSRPELMNRIPLKVVASYLGMTLETLSRLRAQQTIYKT